MLQGRLFSYADTHRHRLGTNYLQIPVNCPFKTRNYHRDGPQTVNDNQTGAPNYFPNSFSGPMHNKNYLDADIPVSGVAKRYDSSDEDNFSQCGIFYRNVLDEGAKKRLVDNIAGHLIGAAEFIQQRQIANFTKCDEDYGRRLKEAIDKLKKQSTGVNTFYDKFLKLHINNSIFFFKTR
jgi:catalase